MTNSASANPTFTPGLHAGSFRQIVKNGFGDPANSYPHSMAWFDGRLYVGVTRNVLTQTKIMLDLKSHRPQGLGLGAWPVPMPDDPYPGLCAEIWRYDPQIDDSKCVHKSPMITGEKGTPFPQSIGFRAMTTFQGRTDSRPVIYTATSGGHQVPKSFILRCEDGERFDLVSTAETDSDDVSPPRANRLFATFRDRLFTSPVAGPQRASCNIPGVMTVLETDDPTRDMWHAACLPSFGERTNRSAITLCEFNNHLYAGTLNVAEGFQLWRTDAEGKPPYRWEKVLAGGAGRGQLNQAALTLCAFKNALYIGTCVQNAGHDYDNGVGPAAPELLRVHPDHSWDLLVGEPRITPHGLKIPLSGHGPGFNDRSAGYLWQMCAHDGWLYAATGVRTAFWWFVDWDRIPGLKHPPDLELVEKFLWNNGGGGLWRSRDGANWSPVTTNGFGNPFNFGIRTMCSTPAGLFVGFANAFGREFAVRRLAGWTYEPNPLGGLEIWLGSSDEDCRLGHRNGVEDPVERIDLTRFADHAWGRHRDAVDDLVDGFHGHSGWDQIGLWGANTTDARAACEELFAEVLAFLPDRDGVLLEIGARRGAGAAMLAQAFTPQRVTSLPGGGDEARAVRDRAPGVRVEKSSTSRLAKATVTFDAIVCVEGPRRFGSVETVLADVFRLLNPGGRVVFVEYLPGGKADQSSRKRWWGRGAKQPETRAAYTQLLEAAGFAEVRVLDLTERSCDRFRENCTTYLDTVKLMQPKQTEYIDQARQRMRERCPSGSRYLLGAAVRPANEEAAQSAGEPAHGDQINQ